MVHLMWCSPKQILCRLGGDGAQGTRALTKVTVWTLGKASLFIAIHAHGIFNNIAQFLYTMVYK